MTDFLTHVITCSLFCVGLHAVTGEGMLLEFVVKPIAKAPHWVKKPLYSCPPCTASFWGSAYYLTFVAIDFKIFLFIFCVAGLNAVLTKFFG